MLVLKYVFNLLHTKFFRGGEFHPDKYLTDINKGYSCHGEFSKCHMYQLAGLKGSCNDIA